MNMADLIYYNNQIKNIGYGSDVVGDSFSMEKFEQIFNARKARSYNKNKMYAQGFGDEDLVKFVREDYNPIPKTVSVMVAMTIQKGVDIRSKKGKDKIKEIWNHNKLDNIIYDQVTEALLSKNLVAEMALKKDKKGDLRCVWVFHKIDNCEIKYDATGINMIYAKIEGYVETPDYGNLTFRKEKYIREYFNTEGVSVEKTTGPDGKSVYSPLIFPFIPVAHKRFDYDLSTAFNKIDGVNDYEAMFRQVAKLNSEGLIIGNKTKEFSRSTTRKLSEKFNSRKIIHAGEGSLSYLEMKATHLREMREQQKELKKDYENEYPEFVLAKVLSGSNISTETTEIKMTEVTAKVDSCREDLDEFLKSLSIKSAYMEGVFVEEDDYSTEFNDIVTISDTALIDNLIKLLSRDLITHETAIKRIPHRYIKDEDEEYRKLKETIEKKNQYELEKLKNEAEPQEVVSDNSKDVVEKNTDKDVDTDDKKEEKE